LKKVTERRWFLKNSDHEAAAKLSGELGISMLHARVLSARGFTELAETRRYLFPDLADIGDPFLLKGMDEAVSRIVRAHEQGEIVCIHGDYDVDGITSVALLSGFFTAVGVRNCHVIPKRLEEGYGLSTDGVDEAARLGASLLITVDCGISSVKEADYCRQKGMDLIVTDHHTPPDRLPEAVAVINPLQPGCGSTFRKLAGVGLALKLAMGVRSRLREKGVFQKGTEPNLREYLDLAALGTIADLVPLQGENRIIAVAGLRQLTQSKRPGIITLKKVSQVESVVTAGDVGFRLAPRLNAAGRLDDAKRGVELLLSDDPEAAEVLAGELDAGNRERQEIEKEILADALRKIESDPTMKGRRSIVMSSENWHPGVIGIVASRLVELYYRPTILISLQNGRGRGSGRSISAFHLFDALLSSSQHMVKFGGHSQAAGLEILEESIDNFYNEFDSYASLNIPPDDLIPTISIDAEVLPEEVTDELVRIRESMSPYGIGNPEPLFLLKGAEVVEARLLKDAHLKLKLRAGGQVFDGIGFKMAEKMVDSGEVDLIFVAEKNVWKGRESLQLKIRDIRRSGGTIGAI
jgi:single-stranded-DNA-specific exonuclease